MSVSVAVENKQDGSIPLTENTALNKEREVIHRQMMSSVSHDLKTPLAGIIGSLEIHDQMKRTLTPEKKQVLLDTALQEAYRLDNFITNILDMAKLENRQVQAKKDLCDIGELLQTCITQMSLRLRDSDVSIIPISGRVAATTDPTLLLRAIGILLDNAVKYGGNPSAIAIEYGRRDFAMCFVRVRDHGRGIPESTMRAIFSKYTRFVRQDMQNAGTGLGLAICREIMLLLEGRVTVDNHPEGGAVFTLHFPVA